jgi:hypothetical protein
VWRFISYGLRFSRVSMECHCWVSRRSPYPAPSPSSLNRIWRSRCISFHEFAANASKFGALNTSLGVRQHRVDGFGTFLVPLANSPSSYGGREVKHRRHAGFGSRLVKTVLDGYVGVRLDLNNTGLACFVGADTDRLAARLEERTGTSRKRGSKPHSHSTRH